MDGILVVIELIIVLLCIVYYYGTSSYNFWVKLQVPFLKPKFPFLGSSYETILGIKSITEHQQTIYKAFKGKLCAGIFNLTHPTLFIRDPELLETVLIKDFSYFMNRGRGNIRKAQPLSSHLLNLNNEEWKSLRSKLTPVFTSGKLKGMHQQLIHCSEELVKYLERYSNGTAFETKDVMSRYAISVISSCAFGLNVDAMENANSELINNSLAIVKPSIKQRLLMSMRGKYPWFEKLFKIRRVSVKTEEYFKKTISNVIDYREKNHIIRNDFLHMLNELKKHDLKEIEESIHSEKLIFDDDVMISNALVFFIAGFETTATLIGFVLYELAINPEVQDKLYKELVLVTRCHGGETEFEALKEAKYLKQIIQETLRKHPPAPEFTREVTKPYKLGDAILPAGVLVKIPVYSIHHDPENFSDPEVFRPERFNEENKPSIKKSTYLPFGDGPRICIGARFAKLESEVALAKIILNYEVTLSRKTISPFRYSRKSRFLAVDGGIWINVRKRNS